MSDPGAVAAVMANPEPEESTRGTAVFPEIAWRGVFADYRDAMDGTTEACEAAHFVTFWACVAVALGRKISMYSGDVVYPNAYLALYGPSGDKKTTAERRIFSCDLLEDYRDDIKIVKNVGSTEGLTDVIAESSTGVHLFFWEEFSSLLSRARWSGSTLLEFVTETFDCPATWGIKYRKNSVDLSNPTPTILTASTPEWFWKYAKAEDFFGGFGNRFLFLTGQKKPAIANPEAPDGAALAHIKKSLAGLKDIESGRVIWSPGAERKWKHIYCDLEDRERSGLLGAATKRAHVYVRKLAMAYAALERTLPEIQVDQLIAAAAVVRWSIDCTEQLIDMQVSQNKPLGELEAKFTRWVANHEGERVRTLQQRMWKYCGDSETFNRVLKNLQQADLVEIRERRVFSSR